MARDTKDSTELVKKVMTGDRFAETDLINKYGRGVLFVLRRESRDPDVINDLYQDTFRIAIHKIRKGDLRDPKKLGAFLSSTARFVAIDYFRKEQRHQHQDVDDIEVAVPQDSQLQRMIQAEHAALVRKIIKELGNDRDRSILFRFYIACEDKLLICDDLELTPLHFNRVLHRAKQRFKELYLKKAKGNTDYASVSILFLFFPYS